MPRTRQRRGRTGNLGKQGKRRRKREVVEARLPMCPVHNQPLRYGETVYGPRYECRVRGCDVMCWGGRTSTPADQPTRTARRLAHEAFDQIWKEKHMSRKRAYRELASLMCVTVDDCHIGQMGLEQALDTVKFSKQIMEELT